MSKLFICEKYSQAEDIAKVLGSARKTSTHWETDGGRVTWCSGHFLELAEPEYYDQKFNRWNFADLPILPASFQSLPKPQTVGQLMAIGQLLRECSGVVIATDIDNEGELIGREVLDYHRYTGQVQRLWPLGLDPVNIRQALGRIKPGSETIALSYAARARGIADWLIGFNGTRGMTIKTGHNGGLVSIGRVQTPTVALVVRRDREIEQFKPRAFFEISTFIHAANGKDVTLSFAPKEEEKRIWSLEQAEKLAAAAQGSRVVIQRETSGKRVAPPALFSLSGLQKKANALWGWEALKTLSIAQSLYERHKATTYPRTDSAYLLPEQRADVPAITANILSMDRFSHLADAPITPRKAVFAADKVNAHSAIIPTAIIPPFNAMTEDELRAYGLIAAHYLASMMPDYEYQSTRIFAKVLDSTGSPVEFSATGITPTQPGWKRAFGKGEIEEQDKGIRTLPDIPNGTAGQVQGVELKTKHTNPPARYTEGTLLEDMCSVAKFENDPAKKARLKETDGIGTEATRASILKTIRDREYVVAHDNQLISTPKGRAMIELLERELPALADPGETAVWDAGLTAVAQKLLDPEEFISGIRVKVRDYIGILSKMPTVGPSGPVNSQVRKQQTNEKKDTNTMSEDTQSPATAAKPKPKVLWSNEDRENNIPATVVVYEPRAKGNEANSWEVYSVRLGLANAPDTKFYELPTVVAGVLIAPHQAGDLAEGAHIQVPKPVNPENAIDAKRDQFLVFQAVPFEGDPKPSTKKPGETFQERKFKVFIGDAVHRSADLHGAGNPIGFRVMAEKGQKGDPEKNIPATKSKYATIWRSPKGLGNLVDPQGLACQPLSLVEAHAIISGGEVIRNTIQGPIKIANKGFTPGARENSLEADVDWTPVQMQSQGRPPQRPTQSHGNRR